ncbi:MAG: amidohydrolase family protein [Dehalococcoidales bacterium]
MTVVDSHMHVNFNGQSSDDIIRYLDRKRIDCCWLLSWEEISHGLWPYQYLSVEDIYEAYLKYPSRIIPFYAPDPHKSDASAQLQNWHQKGIRGCGELKATLNWESDRIRAILQTAKRLKMPLVFHMEESESRHIPRSDAIYDRILFSALETERKIYQIPRSVLRLLASSCKPLKDTVRSYTFPGYMLDFASLEVALRDFPDVNFVAHGPMFWKHISYDVVICKETLPKGPVIGEGIIWRLLRDYPNLYADTSADSGLNALTRDRENAKRFLSLFEDKILYGTDNVIKGQKDFLNSLGLSQGTYKKIYGDNAYRLISI